jgi:hypothetical protein
VGTRFQFIVFARTAVEHDYFLRVLGLCLRHTASISGIAGSSEPAFWSRDAEASASSDASASYYGLAEDVCVFAMVITKLELCKYSDLQVTLPLRAMAPMTVVLPIPGAPRPVNFARLRTGG